VKGPRSLWIRPPRVWTIVSGQVRWSRIGINFIAFRYSDADPKDLLLAKSDSARNFVHATDLSMANLSHYITELVARGRFHFTTDDAAAALGLSIPTNTM
jgi:hypothetical protein